jgi:RsiW-degrading membrane proteinase PrsW (M82 family)
MDAVFYLNVFSALLVSAVWLYYLRNLDIFEPEKWSDILLVFAMGIFTPQLVYLSHHLYLDALFNQSPRGHWEVLVHSVFVIGFVEEYSKFIPVIIIFLFKRKVINEPIDILIYSSASAIGFAAFENVMYFQLYGSELVLWRSLLCVMGHMADTALIGYGLVLFIYKKPRNKWLTLFKYFAFAAIAHGLYDFFLLTDLPSPLGFLLALGSYLVMIEMWSVMVNNCLNNSPFYTVDLKINPSRIQKILFIGFTFIVFNYLGALAYNDRLSESIFSLTGFGAVLLVVNSRISKFLIVKDRWKAVYPSFPFRIVVNQGGSYLTMKGYALRYFELNRLVGKQVVLLTVAPTIALKRKAQKHGYKFTGIITNILDLEDEVLGYVLHLDENHEHKELIREKRLLIVPKQYGQKTSFDYPIVSLHKIPDGFNLRTLSDFKKLAFIDWFMISEQKEIAA